MSDDLKRSAAIAALDEIREGMVVGLGSGSTASIFIRELGERVRSHGAAGHLNGREQRVAAADQAGADAATQEAPAC